MAFWQLSKASKTRPTPLAEVKSDQVGATSKAVGFTGLPAELVFFILDELDHSTLRTLSFVNKWLNGTINERLWRTALLWMPSGLSSSEWRRSLVTKCDALLQSPRRVACTRSLDVRLEGPVRVSSGRGPFKSKTKIQRVVSEQLSRVLRALESLTSLRIHVLSKQRALRPVIGSVLSQTAFRFRLAEFECDSCLEIIDANIYPFLITQSKLESYSACVAPGAHSFTTLTLNLTAQGEHRLTGHLPNLRRYEGPSRYVRAMTAGRDLQSIIVNSTGVFQDLTAQEDTQPPKTLPSATSSRVLLRSRHMDYLSASQLTTLITQTYGISGPSIKHLRIHASVEGGSLWIKQTREVPNHLPARMLESFPNLESLYMKTPAHPAVKYNLDMSEALGFVSDVPDECANLRVITVSADAYYEMRTFLRVDGLVIDGDGPEPPSGLVLEDHRGPIWVLKDINYAGKRRSWASE